MNGLDNVVVAETVVSRIDGQAGRLVVRGQSLEQLAGLDFERMAGLLWEGFCPVGDLAEGRRRAHRHMSRLFEQMARRPAVDALALGLAGLGSDEPATVAGALPVILGAWNRMRQGLEPLGPGDGGQARDLLRMYHGKAPTASQVAALDAYLVTVAEHGMNASTFTARVVASTGAGLTDSVLAALCALKGPLHGGAPGPVLDMLDSLTARDDLVDRLLEKVRSGERLMGFGHRVYRTGDPRAQVLRQALSYLGGSPRLELAAQVEQAALEALRRHKPDRTLCTNVEYYTALLLEALGFERQAFTALFAAGRVLGWTAHYHEQRLHGRLMRPRAAYVGQEPARA